MTGELVWIDGTILPAAQARIDPRDRGLLYGVALFETLRAYRGQPFAVDRHARRLARSARQLEIDVSLPARRLDHAIRELLAASRLDRRDSAVRVTVTGGLDGGGLDQPAASPPVVFVRARAVPRGRGPRRLNAGLADTTLVRPIAGVKSTSYVASSLARREAARRGFDEALLCGTDEVTGERVVLEAATANLFARVDEQLVTPPLDGHVLPGVTRGIVAELATEAGIPVVERPLPVDAIADATEILATASVLEIASVASVEGRPVGDGRVGPWARRLFRAYRARALG